MAWPLPPVHIVQLDERTGRRYQRQPGAHMLRTGHLNPYKPDRRTNPTCWMECAPEPAALKWLRNVAHPSTTVHPEDARHRTEHLRKQRSQAMQRCADNDGGPDRANLTMELHWLPDDTERAALRTVVESASARDEVELGEWAELKSIGRLTAAVSASRETIARLCDDPEATFAATPGIRQLSLAQYAEFHGMWD